MTSVLFFKHAEAERKRGPYTTYAKCDPALIIATIGKLTIDQMSEVSKLSLDGLLKFNLEALERRDLLYFLMDRIDPNDMVLRSIPITPHAVK